MAKNLKWLAIILGLLIALTILIQRSCKLNDTISIYKGRLQAFAQEAKKADEQAKAVISEKEKENAGLVKKNAAILNDSLAIAGKIKVKDAEIANLEKERESLTDKDAIIANQDKIIGELKITLTWEREDKATIKAWGLNWKAAYENEVVVSDEWKAKALREENLKNIAQEIVGKQDNKIRVLQLKSNIKSVLITGLAIYGGYELYRSIKK